MEAGAPRCGHDAAVWSHGRMATTVPAGCISNPLFLLLPLHATPHLHPPPPQAGAPQRVHVMQLAPLIGEWIKADCATCPALPRPSHRFFSPLIGEWTQENHAATPRTPRREDAPPPPPPSEISIGSPRAVFGSGSGSDGGGGGGGGGGSGALASLAWLVLGIAVGLALGSRR